MKNIKLGIKIGGGFGVLILIACALGGMAVFNMKGVEGDSTRMAKEYTDKFYRQAIDAAMMERQKKERGFVKQDLFGRF